MARGRFQLRFILFLSLCTLPDTGSYAHPISHTDAWVAVSEDLNVRLIVFLDDVIRANPRLQNAGQSIPLDDLNQAISDHSRILLQQLNIFQGSQRLSGTVTSEPTWEIPAETVDIGANASVRLSWELKYALLRSAPKSLTFLHNFTHPELERPGELRLQLRTPTGRRMSAVIPPHRPHTLNLPQSQSASPANDPDPNAARSRLIVARGIVVHEFTVPLLWLSSEIADVNKDVITQTGTAIPALSASQAELLKARLKEWFEVHTQFTSSGQSATLSDIRVEFLTDDFNSLSERNDTVEQKFDESRDVPLIGTSVGVRCTYSRRAQINEMELRFRRSPADIEELTVDVVTPLGQETRLVDRLTDADSAFVYHWTPAAIEQNDEKSVTSDGTDSAERFQLVTSEQHRPGRPVLLAGGTAAFLILLSGWLRSPRGHSKGRARLVPVGLLASAAAAGVGAFPETNLHSNQEDVSQFVSTLLSDLYEATGEIDFTSGIDRLFRLMQADVAEDVYLALLDSTPAEGMLIETTAVDVTDLQVEVPTTPDKLGLQCRWNVTGTIHHWGHVHDRQLSLAADITLIRAEHGWQISGFSLTEAEVTEAPSDG